MSRSIISLLIGLMMMSSSIAQTATEFYDEGIKLKDKKEYADAVASFKKAIAAKPNYKDALFQAGWCSNEISKYDDAISFLLKAKQQSPNEAKIFLELGYAYQQKDEPRQSEINLRRCIELEKDYALAYKYLGNLYYNKADYEHALENYVLYAGYEDDITSDDFYYKKGYCENEQGKYKDAIESLNKSIELKDDEPTSFDELGYAYYKLENADESIKSYKRSIALKPNSNVPYLGLGDVYRYIKKDHDLALTNYLKAVEYKSESKKGQYCVGWCYNEKEKYNEAIPYLKKAVSIDKNYISAITELGYSYYAMAEYNNALALFDNAITLDKKDALSIYYSGLCYVGLKNKTSALRMHNDLKMLGSTYADKLKNKIDGM